MKHDLQMLFIRVVAIVNMIWVIAINIVMYPILNSVRELYQDFGAIDSIPLLTKLLLNGGSFAITLISLMLSMFYVLFVFINKESVKGKQKLFLLISISLILVITFLTPVLVGFSIYYPIYQLTSNLD